MIDYDVVVFFGYLLVVGMEFGFDVIEVDFDGVCGECGCECCVGVVLYDDVFWFEVGDCFGDLFGIVFDLCGLWEVVYV